MTTLQSPMAGKEIRTGIPKAQDGVALAAHEASGQELRGVFKG